jgi:hypothetical protein
MAQLTRSLLRSREVASNSDRIGNYGGMSCSLMRLIALVMTNATFLS